MTHTKDGFFDCGRARAAERRLGRDRDVIRSDFARLAAVSVVGFCSIAAAALGSQGRSPLAMLAAAPILANRSVQLAQSPPLTSPGADPADIRTNRPASVGEVSEAPSEGSAPETLTETAIEIMAPDAAVDRSAATLAPPVQLASAAGMTTAQQPAGGPGGAPPGAFVKSVTIGESLARRIVVAKNQSAAIDLAVRIDRAQIVDPSVAAVVVESPTRVIVRGVEVGTTQLRLVAGSVERLFDVHVELDLGLLNDMIQTIAPGATVRARSLRGTIVLTGGVPSGDAASRIAELAEIMQGAPVRNHMDVVGVQQTMLRVIVAEVNKDATRRLGVNWAIGGSDLSRDFFFANNLNQINPTSFGSSGLPNVLQGQQLFSVAPVANGLGTNVTFGFPRIEFQMFINALRENNLFRILAEPNLVAISGQSASFLAGGEVPIPVTQGGAVAGAITIDYKEFGIRLAFTPTIVGGQRMRLHIMTEVSEVVPGTQIAGGLPVFSFTTRRVESTIECGNGQTFAIAGLLRESVQAIASKIPALGDIPVLGALFSSVEYQQSKTELVILVTPQLVEPLDPHQVVPPPGALMTHPSDYELFGLQKLEGTPHPVPEYDGAPRDEVPVNTRPRGSGWMDGARLTLHGPWGLAEYADGEKSGDKNSDEVVMR